MNAKQLTECIAYNSVEPFGHDTLFFLIGQLTSILFNVNKGKNTPTKKAWDFIPFIRQGPKKQDGETMKGLLMALVNETNPNKPKEMPKKIKQSKYSKKRAEKLKQERRGK